MASLLVSALLAMASPVLAGPSSVMQARQSTDASTTNGTVTYSPVSANTSTETPDIFTPQYNATLPYSDSTTTSSSLVSVGLTTEHGNVLLESLTSVVSVSCAATGDSVSMVFDSAANLQAAYSEWSLFTHLLFTTNHMGDCDSEFERGFFVAESFTTDVESLTLIASAEKADLGSVA
ncbi:hypothetical protein BD289DRAFT_449585, partial [Coniella lustricola]